jgi:AhpD family alkylhydroperoxidase
MHPRMNHPVMILPQAMQALQALHNASLGGGLPEPTIKLVHLRASQINGCGVCVDMHAHEMKRAGESERAALALTEAVTRLADRPDAVPDEIWNEAARHYDDRALAALLIAIAGINVWNRLNAATRQVAGAWAREAAAARR